MEDYSAFKNRHTVSRQSGKFTDVQLATYTNKLPDDVLNFLKVEGRCTFSNDFLWTVLPDDLNFTGMYEAWGLKNNDKRYTFMRTALGVCFYYYKGKYYYLDPLGGLNGDLTDSFRRVFNTYLIMDTFIVEGFAYEHYLRLKEGKPLLQQDEIYGFVPALPIGGSFETSRLEVVKMYEHLLLLASMFDNKVKEI